MTLTSPAQQLPLVPPECPVSRGAHHMVECRRYIDRDRLWPEAAYGRFCTFCGEAQCR